MMQSKILKGKAWFYSYKRKLQSVLVNPNIRMTKEGRVILGECLSGMKESITLLGSGLDQGALDEEGSKIFDWAMIDCLTMVNKLKKCERCFLCRQKKEPKKSHIIPEFIAKSLQDDPSERSIIFDPDKYKLKSAGECYFNMLCWRCEELLCQNGENDFKAKFPSSGEVQYSSWLFSYCVGVIFRCMASSSQFPMHFNDEEVYQVLLHCRRHLLQLPVVIEGKVSSPSEQEKRQLEELTEQIKGDLHVYLFMSPLNSRLNFGALQAPYPTSAFAFARNKQLDSKGLNFNGRVHFFSLCCGPITLIIQFDQSLVSLKNKGFHLASNPLNSDTRYCIPSEEDRVKLLPVGIWPLIEQLTEATIENFKEVSRCIAPNATLPEYHPVEDAPTVKVSSEVGSAVMFEMSFLPREYEIDKPHVNLPRNQCVLLPAGDQVIIHSSRRMPVPNTLITTLLCLDEHKFKEPGSEFLYLIFVEQDDTNHILYVDGIRVLVRESKLVLTEFLLNNPIAGAKRQSLSMLQVLVNILLPNKHFDNIKLLLHLVKCRR